MHSGGGVPASIAKSSNSSQGTSTDPPPPIPARRLASHPPTAPGGKTATDGQHGHGATEKEATESHSAPSSPTEKAKKEGTHHDSSRAAGSPRHSKSPDNQRPRSVAVDLTSGLNYAQVQFTNGHSGRPVLNQRRNTKYTSIAYQQENAAEKKSMEMDGHLKTEAGSSQQSSRSPGHRHTSSPRGSPVPPENTAVYDVPPPVPVRLDLLETEGENPPGEGHNRHSSDPFHSSGGGGDPFSQDPFGGDSGGGAWEDPTAFYDKPPHRQPIPARSEATGSSTLASTAPQAGGESQQPPASSDQQTLEDSIINSTDFTGDSSYEDTCEVLKNIRLMKYLKEQKDGKDPYAPAAEVFMGQDKKSEKQTSSEQLSPEFGQAKSDSYEYPLELAKYPHKKDICSVPEAQPRSKEEPTLHTFNYSAKLQTSVPSGGVTRHESFSRSSRNMPLPPIPGEASNQQPWVPLDHAPPLPARAGANAGKPPLPGNHPSTRKSVEDPPRLPPMNHPWGNKRHPGDTTTPTSDSNPPLPPRKKDASDVPGAAQQQRKEDLALRELVALGYSKAEIDRALKITRNDYSMAKMILQEFGGRH